MSNFKALYVGGQISFDELDDYIEQWHSGSGKESLKDFLGLTDEEYLLMSKGMTELQKELDSQKKVSAKLI